MSISTTAHHELTASLAGWSQDVGWRIEGWVALAALGVLWRPPAGTLDLDGPARSDAADLSTAVRHLHFLADARWSLIAGGSNTTRAAVTLQRHGDGDGDRAQAQPLAFTWHGERLSAVQADPPTMLRMPPPTEMLARQAYLVAAAPVETGAWRTAVIDAAALVTCVPTRQRNRMFELLPTWVSDRARARLNALDDDFVDRYFHSPGDHASEALDELRERWRPQ